MWHCEFCFLLINWWIWEHHGKIFSCQGHQVTCPGLNGHPIARKNTIFRQDWAPSHFLQFQMGPSIIWAIQDRFISKILMSRIRNFQKSSSSGFEQVNIREILRWIRIRQRFIDISNKNKVYIENTIFKFDFNMFSVVLDL